MWSIPDPMLVREPRPERVPLRIGVHHPPEFRGFTYRYHLADTTWVLGKPSVRLLNDALALLFAEVVEVRRRGSEPSERNDLAGIIEPRIVSAAYAFPNPGSHVFLVNVTYGFTLYSPRGEPIVSWNVTGSVSTELRIPLAAVVRRSFEHAMREAAFKFTSGFQDVPEVGRWLAERAVRKE